MIKNNQFLTNKTRTGALCLIIFMLVIVNLSVVSALDFNSADNTRTISEDRRSVTVWDTDLFSQDDKLADIELTTEFSRRMISNDYAFEFKLTAYDKSNFELEFYNKNNMDKINTPTVLLKYYNPIGEYEETVYDYEKVCELAGNGTSVCTNEISGTHKETKQGTWIEFTDVSEIPNGEQIIRGYYPDLKPGEVIEWIPTFYGMEVSEWADFSLLTKYERFTSAGETVGIWSNGFAISMPFVVGWTGANVTQNITGIEIKTGGADCIAEWNVTITGVDGFDFANSNVPNETIYSQNESYISSGSTDTGFNISLPSLESLNPGGFYTMVIQTNQTSVNAECQAKADEVGKEYGVTSTTSNDGFASTSDQTWSLYFQMFGFTTPISTTHSFPADDFNQISTNVTMGCNSTAATSTLSANMIKVYDSSNDLFFTDIQDASGSSSFNSQISGIFPGDRYTWECFTNDTTNTLLDNTGNRTFSTMFIENSQTFNNNTLEGSIENFEVNLTLGSGVRISTANLNYNGTEYLAVINGITDVILNRSITVPNIATGYNLSFFWKIDFDNGIQVNTSTQTQNVGVLGVDNCTTFTNELFNMTMYDERTQDFLVGSTHNTSIQLSFTLLDNTGSTELLNISQDFASTNPARLCLQNNLTGSSYELNGVIKYSSNGRFTEFYNFQNYEVTNTTNNIKIALYNLNNTEGTEFKISFKDSNFVAVDGAIMNIQRKYIDEGVFKTTEIPKTGVEGYTIAHLVRNDVIYNIIISKAGVVLGSFTDVVADCQNPTLFACTINLNAFTSSALPSDFTNLDDISFSLTYNRTSRLVKSIYTIPSGITSTVDLNVTLFDSLGNRSVCADSLSASGGQLDCTVPLSFGNSTVIAKIHKDGEFIGQAIIMINPKPSEIYGTNVIFLSILVFLIFLGLAGTSDNPMVVGVALILGSFIMIALNLIYTPTIYGIGATILWFIMAVILVMVKGAGRQ